MPSKLGGEFQVNTYTTNEQSNPSIAALSDGNFVTVWQSAGQDGSSWGVYGQIFTASGTKVSSEFSVTYTPYEQYGPSIAALINGNFVAMWHSNGQDGSGFGIYGQVFTASGTKVGSEFQVNTYTTNHQGRPSIAALINGNFVAVWDSAGQDGSNYGIYGQVFTAGGTKVDSEFQVNTYTANDQFYPSIAALSNGNFVAMWDSAGQDGSSWGVYGQIFTASGAKVGSEFSVNTYTPYEQYSSSIAALSNGNFVAVWHSNGQDGSNFGIYGQVFTANGARVGSEFQVNTYTTSHQSYPSIALLSNGNFVAVWNTYGPDGSDYGIYGQVFTAGGTKVGSEFQVNTYTANGQLFPSIAALSNGNFVAAWQSNGQDGSGNGVYGQVFYGQIVANNVDQPSLSYTEDMSFALSNLSILGALNEKAVSVTLMLSPASDGSLNTATAGSVTSTYNGVTGNWNASGNLLDINTLLSGLVFTPTVHGNQNVTIAVNITDGASTPVTGTWNLAGIPVDDGPILVNNQLALSKGQVILLSSANLSATDIDNSADTLTFTISNLQGGRFELTTNPGVAVTSFTQQQITDGNVSFVHDGGESAPAYEVSVNDGDLSTSPASASITFSSYAPVLGNHQLTVSQGKSIILTGANLSATDADLPPNLLTFTVISVQHARFELTNNIGTAISSFTEEQIANGEVRFVHDGTDNAPAYQVSVDDGVFSTPFFPANVTFIPKPTPTPFYLTPFYLTTLNGVNGFVVNGIASNARLGISVSTAGDINGDGKTDLVLGASGVSNYAGAAYVIFGQSNFTSPFNLTTLNGANGFVVNGRGVDSLGHSVSMAGDINGDGKTDLVLGAPYGGAYVIFGRSNFTSPFNLTTLNGINGFMVNGIGLGWSVSTTGDINRDGKTDLVLGAPYASNGAGAAYVIFGRSNFTSPFNVTTLNGVNGFVVNGIANSNYLGRSVSTAGDINGDGKTDLVLGADGVSSAAGVAYVIFGRSNFASPFNLTTLNGTNGFVVNGITVNNYLGYSVSAAGDINGDGKTDLVLGAYGAGTPVGTNKGTAYVLFGQSNFTSPFSVTTLNGVNGFVVNGIASNDRLGYSVSTAGDINGDGKTDLVLGAVGVSNYVGAVYVLFGRSNFTSPFNVTTLNGVNGFVVNGVASNNWLGYSVSTAEDINGDGKTDLVLGAPYASNGAGAAYVIFDASKPPIPPPAPAPTPTPRINRPPTVTHAIPDQPVEVGTPFNFEIASDTFTDPDGDNLIYSAHQADGLPLPSWLAFDTKNRFFSGIASLAGTTPLRVDAMDTGNLSTSIRFNLLATATSTPSNNLAAIVGGGIAGLGALIGAGYGFYRKCCSRPPVPPPPEPDDLAEIPLDDIIPVPEIKKAHKPF